MWRVIPLYIIWVLSLKQNMRLFDNISNSSIDLERFLFRFLRDWLVGPVNVHSILFLA